MDTSSRMAVVRIVVRRRRTRKVLKKTKAMTKKKETKYFTLDFGIKLSAFTMTRRTAQLLRDRLQEALDGRENYLIIKAPRMSEEEIRDFFNPPQPGRPARLTPRKALK
jgi:hypothetical protein